MPQTHPVFHAGETAVQDRAGVPLRTRDMAARAIRDAMPEQHQAFFAALPLAFLALLDRHGRPWAIPASGPPGFVKATSARQLVLGQTPPFVAAFALDTSPGAKIGLLGLDFATRRRNRVNGRVLSCGETLKIAVEQSFGNCPKYIQTRAFEPANWPVPATLRRPAPLNGSAARSILAGADTFFIASRAAKLAQDGSEGLDISHRGGRPGFLSINEDGTVSFPDFAGNRYFNTLGNIAADGRVGLFVPDFASGAALCATGRASIDWSSERAATLVGAERIVDVTLDEIWHVEAALPAPARLIETRLDGWADGVERETPKA